MTGAAAYAQIKDGEYLALGIGSVPDQSCIKDLGEVGKKDLGQEHSV